MRSLGYKPDVPDERDLKFSAHRVALDPVQETSDVDLWDVNAKNQHQTSSCVGQGCAGGLRRALTYQLGMDCPELSAAFAYRGALDVDCVNVDEGTHIRSGSKYLMTLGCATEDVMPFSEGAILDPINFKASRDAFDRRRPGRYHRILPGDVDGVCRALSAGMPVVAGWQVSEAFASSNGREIFTRQAGSMAGGHCMAIVGHGSSSYYEKRISDFRPNRSYTRLYRLLQSWGGSLPTEPVYGYNGRIFVDEAFVADATDIWAFDVREAA